MTQQLHHSIVIDERRKALACVALSPAPQEIAERFGHRHTQDGDRAKARRLWRRSALTFIRESQEAR